MITVIIFVFSLLTYAQTPIRLGLVPTAGLQDNVLHEFSQTFATQAHTALLVPKNTIPDLLKALQRGEVDLAFLPPFAAIHAEGIVPYKLFLVTNEKRPPSALVVRSEKLKRLGDLKGADIAWGPRTSASLHIIPKATLMAKKISPNDFLQKQLFLPSQADALKLLRDGTVQIAAVECESVDCTKGPWPRQTRPIIISDTIPGPFLLISKDLEKNPAVVSAWEKKFLSLKPSLARQLFLAKGFRKIEPKELETLRAISLRLGEM